MIKIKVTQFERQTVKPMSAIMVRNEINKNPYSALMRYGARTQKLNRCRHPIRTNQFLYNIFMPKPNANQLTCSVKVYYFSFIIFL
jgi:hypothetical protein